VKKITCLCLLLALISACALTKNEKGNNENKTGDIMLKDITYNKRSNSSFTIYIKEDDSFEPYLVIDNNYSNGVLLLRKYLLDEEVIFNDQKSQGSNGGYYPASNVDTYLNTIYFSKLSSELQDIILDATISVSTLEGVGGGGSIIETENIQRKIFLLSATELNIKSGMASKEGIPLDYFNKTDNWIAVNKNGEARNYWLRSAYHWDDIQAWVIASDGTYGGASVSSTLAIRPAFCIPGNISIKEENVNGESVYVIS